LRIGVDIRREEKSNGVCRENEKSSEESRGSIEKSIEEDEVTSR